MGGRKVFLLVIVIAFCTNCFAQKTPTLVSRYSQNSGFPFGRKNLTLSSDNIFFFATRTENEHYVARGIWTIKNKKLYLNCFDSTQAYPNLKIDFIRNGDNKNVVLSAIDYFNSPFGYLEFGLIRHKDTTIYNASHFFTDSSGKLIIPKKEYKGLFLIYQFESYLVNRGIQSYIIDKDITDIKIYIDFESSAGLGKGVVLMNFGNRIYKIRKNALYFNGKKEFELQKNK